MKNMIRIVAIIGLLSLSMLAYSGEITDIYTTGDTLTTTTLNNIKGAVNDNNARVSTLEGSETVQEGRLGALEGSETVQDGRLDALEAAYIIGDTGPAGGWVFYVDADGRHGLEAAPTDQGAAIRWYSGTTPISREARGDGVGAGEMNTMLIIATHGVDSNTYAAGICANLVITNNAGVKYGDWYLPSKYELNLMYLNIGQGSTIGNVGGFASNYYWSSSEFGIYLAWVQDFSNGGQFAGDKGVVGGVRAVRAF